MLVICREGEIKVFARHDIAEAISLGWVRVEIAASRYIGTRNDRKEGSG